MGLSVPTDKDPINGGVSQALKFDHKLLQVTSGAGLNQVRGINNDGSTGNGIPQHVTNVSSSTSRASAATTSTVTITFKRDSTDVAYAGVTVWAKGYQGNPSLVQIAAGVDSPVNINVVNTGESVSFQVQAYGNGGYAPLASSPTTGVRLPLGASGYGTGTIVTPPGTTYVPPTFVAPAWWNSGDGSNFAWSDGANGFFATGAGNPINTVKFWMIRIPVPIIISKLSTRILTGVAASVAGYAVYDATGQTKLFSWDNINTGSSNTNRTTTLVPPVTLNVGVYCVASACSTLSTVVTESGYSTAATSEPSRAWNINGTVRTGQGSNLMVSGVMPSSLGTLTTTTGLATLPLVTMEA